MHVRRGLLLVMFLANGPDSVERALLAAGTASYECVEFPSLEEVPDALRAVVRVLRNLGFATVVESPGYRLDPTLMDLRAAVRKAAVTAPVVVVYYTGHGVGLESSTYYLVSKKSRPADLEDSALAARDLLTLLTPRDDCGVPLDDQPTALVILDCCYSGSAGRIMLEETLRGIGNSNIWVIATAGPLEYAQQGLFAKAFCDALQRPTTGVSQRFVSLETIAQDINDAQAGKGIQKARVFSPVVGLTGIPPFFPNPYHQPSLAGMTVADQQHWISRVRGGPDETTVGFYLTGKTGRLRAARDLAEWITSPEPKNMAVVTGSPGTGKSALLALSTLLTDQSQRRILLRSATAGSLIEYMASILPADTPVAAVHVRGLNADQVAGLIAGVLDRDAKTAIGLLELLDDSPLRNERVVVVDAVDEAISPAALLGGLLVPLSRQQGLRVVVGARRHVLGTISNSDTIIDLDSGTYRDPKALIHYIHQLLTAAEEPGIATCYQPDSAAADITSSVATAAAEAIAQRATARNAGPESFLIGRLLALSVRNRTKPVDITKPGWQFELPASIATAFDEDLARLGDKQPLARALLEALAWAKGPGLPWETIWLPVARALADYDHKSYAFPLANDDVRWLLHKAGSYVVEDVGPGERSAYRPFHDLLAVHLRGEPSAAQMDSDLTAEMSWKRRRSRVEEIITDTLLATVQVDEQARPDWSLAHPYLRTYLAEHAAAAGTGVLAMLAQDVEFLAVADPTTLSPCAVAHNPRASGHRAHLYARPDTTRHRYLQQCRLPRRG